MKDIKKPIKIIIIAVLKHENCHTIVLIYHKIFSYRLREYNMHQICEINNSIIWEEVIYITLIIC